MTKKNYLSLTVVLSIILFIVFIIYMPIEVAGHRPGNVPLLIINAGFLAVTATVMMLFITILITRGEYVQKQIMTFARYRYLLFLMIKRDFITRYRRNVLGILWSLLNPLLTMLVLTMIFSMLFRFDIPNFPVYLLSGQLIFNFFSESTNQAMGSIINNASTIKKVYVPKYIFPISKVISSIVNLFFSFLAFLIVYIITGEPFRWTIFLIPISFIYIFVFSLGVGMLLSSMAVFFRDITYLYGIFITLLLFLTPIFYPVSILPNRIYHLIHLNPLFHYVTYFRELTLNGSIPNLWSNIICIGFALAAFCLGLYVKMSQQDKYILYL